MRAYSPSLSLGDMALRASSTPVATRWLWEPRLRTRALRVRRMLSLQQPSPSGAPRYADLNLQNFHPFVCRSRGGCCCDSLARAAGALLSMLLMPVALRVWLGDACRQPSGVLLYSCIIAVLLQMICAELAARCVASSPFCWPAVAQLSCSR